MGGDNYVILINSQRTNAHAAARELDAEVTRLRAENANLRAEVEKYWLECHSEVCTNMDDCQSFGGSKQCCYARPDCLQA